MNRRTFLKATGAAALAAAVPGGCREPFAGPYNLLFVMADQWRFSALGGRPDSPVATPNIDRLAAEGLLCKRAYVANPVCAPSRGSIMTGRFPHEHGRIGDEPDEAGCHL